MRYYVVQWSVVQWLVAIKEALVPDMRNSIKAYATLKCLKITTIWNKLLIKQNGMPRHTNWHQPYISQKCVKASVAWN